MHYASSFPLYYNTRVYIRQIKKLLTLQGGSARTRAKKPPDVFVRRLRRSWRGRVENNIWCVGMTAQADAIVRLRLGQLACQSEGGVHKFAGHLYRKVQVAGVGRLTGHSAHCAQVFAGGYGLALLHLTLLQPAV